MSDGPRNLTARLSVLSIKPILGSSAGLGLKP